MSAAAAALYRQANAQLREGALADAVASYRSCLALDPDAAAAYANLGSALKQQGDLPGAIGAFRRAVALDPALAEGHNNLANALAASGAFADAEASFRAALAARPDYAEAHFNFGCLLYRLQRREPAIAAYRRALDLRPDLALAWVALAETLKDERHFDEALFALQRALALDPRNADARNQLGNVLTEKGQLAEAVQAYQQALTERPNNPEVLSNLGNILTDLNRFDLAERCFQAAIRLDPQHIGVQHNRALSLLQGGDFARGWPAHEIRFRRDKTPPRPFDQPFWDGQPLNGRSLLIWGEQGIGDEILYAGMVPDLSAQDARIMLECEPRLVPLFARAFPGAEVAPRTDPPQAVTAAPDLQVATASLGQWLRPDWASFPRHRGYLQADPEQVERLRRRYRESSTAPLVGLSWRSRNEAVGAFKSTRLIDWAPVLRVPGIRFVNLQYGDCADELAAAQDKLGVTILHDAEIDPLRDLDGFAAQVAALDLVISISNSTVHFAGALGRPVWTVLPSSRGSLWYWFSGREDSPWYPSMRLLRLRHDLSAVAAMLADVDWPELTGRG